MCAFKASLPEKMESLSSTGGPGWYVLGVSGRQAWEGSPALAGQKMDSGYWMGSSVNVDIMPVTTTFYFPQSTLLWHQHTQSPLRCQCELQP
jgi:hypothetical protein